jgi:hypothetical protein
MRVTKKLPLQNCQKLQTEGAIACHFCQSFKNCKIVQGKAVFKPSEKLKKGRK